MTIVEEKLVERLSREKQSVDKLERDLQRMEESLQARKRSLRLSVGFPPLVRRRGLLFQFGIGADRDNGDGVGEN